MHDRLDVKETWEIAQITISILQKAQLVPFLFGSVAGKTYGLSRNPNDVDIVVLTRTHTTAQLKALLVEADSRFYLIRSGDPFATHKILWFRVGELPSNSEGGLRGFSRKCKVDVLIPGDLGIPYMDGQLIVHRMVTSVPLGRRTGQSDVLQQPLPVMPLLHLLCFKVQGWFDHRESNKEHFQTRHPADAKDICEMLQFACTHPELVRSMRASDSSTELDTLRKGSTGLVLEFIEYFPDTGIQWRQLGFAV
ncbi:hypothetical protein BDN72DRAFT_819283 [Pluteus cervinus]|uniref:Uncharacterized protein n=1 Tax=Pluteus cervinus TaxID=181527 RepID=A0ACD3AWQ7_9AGAR|nr:hypothetical protein BDN72DRAFT_819283 [Pluteus cervinus]